MPKKRDISGLEDNLKTSGGPKGKNYLLAIAIDEYKNVTPLSNCVKDANDFINVLEDRFSFQSENIFRLFNEKATLGQINRTLDEYSEKVTKEDNIIIYFSGHGHYKSAQKEGYLIPVEGEKKAYWTYLSNSNFLAHIRAINSFHTLLIIDCCFSGSLFATKDIEDSFTEKVGSFPSRWGLAAGMIEKVSDGYHGENSPFAKAVITFLEGVNKAKVSVSDLIQYVKKATSNNADQRPVGGPLFKVGDMNGEFVFELSEEALPPTPIEDDLAPKIIKPPIVKLSIKRLRNILGQGNLPVFFDEVGRWLPAQENIKMIKAKFNSAQKQFEAFLGKKELNAIEEDEIDERRRRIEFLAYVVLGEIIEHLELQKGITQASKTGILIDPRDKQSYQTLKMRDGNIWMIQNLNFYVQPKEIMVEKGLIFKAIKKEFQEQCFFYENDPQYEKDYGRLYHKEVIERACPPGWHLPNAEEWRTLGAYYGGVYEDGWMIELGGEGETAYEALRDKGISGFNAKFGGYSYSENSFDYIEAQGKYWSSSINQNDTNEMMVYYFSQKDKFMGEVSWETKKHAFAIRCIKD